MARDQKRDEQRIASQDSSQDSFAYNESLQYPTSTSWNINYSDKDRKN